MVQKRGISKDSKRKSANATTKSATQNASSCLTADKAKGATAAKQKFRILQALKQAQDSLKQVKLPTAAERKQFTRSKILLGLKGLGVATQSDVDALQAKIKKIESALRG